jgi:hypothetical protein
MSTGARYPLEESVAKARQNIQRLLSAIGPQPFGVKDAAMPLGTFSRGNNYYDFGAALNELARQGELRKLANGTYEITAQFQLPIDNRPATVATSSSPYVPVEIQESLAAFRQAHPEPGKIGFIVMKFSKSKAHDNIVQAIRNTLSPFGIQALRADDRRYHDDLYQNIQTYMYGCGFGIAVFERLESDVFNPNVSLEVGYMLALKKPVFLLKEKTLPSLQADIVGKLYESFDTQDPIGTIPSALSKWMKDKGVI